MNCKLLSVVVLCGAGLFLVSGQTDPAGVFTAAQAEEGRTAYDNACGKCHTSTLLGRRGDKGELPPLASLSAPYQKFIGARGFVPPLAGEAFLKKWGGNTAAQLFARFKITADDPFFQFEGMNDETILNITAHILQVNGAKPGTQALTPTTDAIVNAITR